MNFDLTPAEWEEIYRRCSFTDVEHDVINLKRRGKKVGYIADELHYSDSTVKRITKRIVRKIIFNV